MHYQTEVVIDVPRSAVVALFDNPENMAKWQPELLDYEHISGTPGEVGARARLKYKMGKREIEMIETVTERNLPDRFAGTYEADGCWNQIVNRFTEAGPGRTRWTADNEFRPTNFFMRAMMFLLPGAFRKQTLKFMHQFKDFAEKEHKMSAAGAAR